MFIITCIEITIFQSFTVLYDEKKRQIDFKHMTLMIINVFIELFRVVDKTILSDIEII